jgi:hypothetical protein
MFRRLVLRGALAGVTWIAAVGAATADPAPTRPVRDAIAVRETSCIQRDVLAAEIAGWIKADSIDSRLLIVVDGDARTEVGFDIARDGTVVGRRTFRTRAVTCPNVTALLSLAIAMAIDATPLTALESTPTAPAPSAPVTTVARTATPTTAPASDGPMPSPPAARPPRLLASLELSTFFGVLPRPALAGAIAVSVALGAHAWLRAASFDSASVDAPLGGGRFDSSVAGGEVDACLSAGRASLLWRACAGAAFGRVVATGGGFDVPATATLPWAAVTTRVEAILHVGGPFDVMVLAAQALPLPSPPKLDVKRGDTTVAATTLPAAGLAFGVGPVLQFW